LTYPPELEMKEQDFETVPLQLWYRWGTPAYWSIVPRCSMFYLFEFVWKICSLIQQILSHCFYDWKLCEWYLLSECPHHFWTYTSNVKTVVNSVLKIMINGITYLQYTSFSCIWCLHLAIDSLSLWKFIVYYRLCRLFFDKILVSEYKLSKRSNKANLFWTYTSNVKTVVNSVLKIMINGITYLQYTSFSCI
jgi:hypothetical protein